MKLIGKKEVAELLGVSQRTVHQYLVSGYLPAAIRVRRFVRWRESDIEKWIEHHAGTSRRGRPRKTER